METIDPTTGQPLPPDAIQRVLYIASKVHVYQIPPLASTKGYNAASWTANNNERLIFTARLRLLETAVPKSSASSASNPAASTPENASTTDNSNDSAEDVKVDLLLEDPASGQLFAGAPYTTPAVVEQALDSSRFFAVRVVGDGGRKAVLGLGFEERSEAVDFNIALQDARKVLGLEPSATPPAGGPAKLGGAKDAAKGAVAEEKKDFSLKEGETITVNIGGRGRRKTGGSSPPGGGGGEDPQAALFSIKPPPPSGGGGAVPFLPPPPTASSVKAERRRSRPLPPQQGSPPAEKQPSPHELGFDDGEFGEFQ